MNLGQIVDQVYTHVQDTTRSYIREDSVIGWVNEGLFDLDARYGHTVATTYGTFQNDGDVISLPPDLVQIEFLRIDGEEDNARFLSNEDWSILSYNDASYSPSAARVYGGVIEVYPNAEAGTSYALRYVAEPEMLDTNTDVPKLPAVLHRKLVLYATSEALFQEGNFGLAQLKRADYEDGLPDVPASMLRKTLEIITIPLVPGPFDVQDARHI